MRVKNLLSLIAAGVLVTGILCTDKTSDPVVPVVEQMKAIGTWEYPISIPSILPDTLQITLSIAADSTYDLSLTQHVTKTLFSSKGTWKATPDSIFLVGNRCLILDTVPDPDTLAPLADSLCSAPIPLALPESATLWNIQTKQLAVMLKAFPIDPKYAAIIPVVFGNLELKKSGT